MGGDHKCPVCEATFTRPQHVARHMRSRELDADIASLLTIAQIRETDHTSANIAETSLLEGVYSI